MACRNGLAVMQAGCSSRWVRHAGFDVKCPYCWLWLNGAQFTQRSVWQLSECVHVPTVIRHEGNRRTAGDSYKQWCFTRHLRWASANTDNETVLQGRNKCDFTAAQPWHLFTQCATQVNTTSHQESHATFTLPSSVGRNAFRPQKSMAPVQSVNSAGPLSFFTPINQRQSTEDSNEQWYSSSNSNLSNRR